MFHLYHAGDLVAEVVMWKDKSVTIHYIDKPHYEVPTRSLASLTVSILRTRQDTLVEVDSEGREGQRWEGQRDEEEVPG